MDLMIIIGVMLLLGIIFCTIGEINDIKWASRVGGGLITLLILGGILFFLWAIYSEDMEAKNKGIIIISLFDDMNMNII